MAVDFVSIKGSNSNVNLTVPRLKSGGYYTPDVSAEGDLTWTPSREDMPEVETVNIKGPQGEAGPQGEPGQKGDPGIYVGTEEPTDPTVLIWINPAGENTNPVATENYVQEQITSTLESIDVAEDYTF